MKRNKKFLGTGLVVIVMMTLASEMTTNAGSACVVLPVASLNNGHCSALVDGTGDVCIVALVERDKNCYINSSLEGDA